MLSVPGMEGHWQDGAGEKRILWGRGFLHSNDDTKSTGRWSYVGEKGQMLGKVSPGTGRLFYGREDSRNAEEDVGRYVTIKISSFVSLPQTPRNR